jgi:peptidoglycan hydrolase CwlO-like protein
MARRFAILAVGCLLLAAPAAGDNGHSIGEVQAKLSAARQKEAHLTQQISGLTAEIRTLEGRVGDVSQKLSVLETDLQLHERRLDKLDDLYAFETERLNFLRRAYATAVHQLNLRMIDLYETHDPTLVEVIINSQSFQDALDRIHYLDSIAQSDKHIAAKVAVARDAVHKTREQTKVVRERVHAETLVVAARTQQQRDMRDQLLASKSRLSGKRASQQTALKLTRKQEHTLQTEAQALAAADASIRGRLAAAQGATDTTPSAAGLVWPVSGPVRVPLGPPPRRHRHRGPLRDADPRRSRRHRRPGGLGERVRQLHLHRPRRRSGDLLCPPVVLRRLPGRRGEPGAGDRLRGLHRPLLRAAPPFRGQDQRRARRSPRLPLARNRIRPSVVYNL